MRIQTERIIKRTGAGAWPKRVAAMMTAVLMITGITPVTVSASEVIRDMSLTEGGILTRENAPVASGSEETGLIGANEWTGAGGIITGEGGTEEILSEALETAVPETLSVEAEDIQTSPVEAEATELTVPDSEVTGPEELTEQDEVISYDAVPMEEPGNEGVVAYDDPEQLYSVHYILEYNGRQLSRTTTPVKADSLERQNKDGTWVYSISPDKAFFKGSYEALLKGSEKTEKGIVSYNIIMKAVYKDGRQIKDEEGRPVTDKSTTISANAFDENGYQVPLTYNDVYVYAQIGAYATDMQQNGVVISAATGVRYCGLAHKLSSDPAAIKRNAGRSANYDIDIRITDYKGDGSYELKYGRDYTVQYKNNKNASVRFTGDREEDGYVQIYGSHEAAAKWPQIIITGRGNYKGLKSTVYFDILPAPVADGCMAVGPFADGVKESYKLNKAGGITMTVAPVRYASVYDDETGSYVADTGRKVRYGLKRDVTVELQKYNSETKNWERLGDLTDSAKRRDTLRSVTQEGDYRIQIKGTGNFHGNLYDTFSVFGNSKVLFSTLKLKTVKATYKSEGVNAEALITGISTSVRSVSGARAVIPLSELDLALEPASESASVSGNKTTALSAGVYTVSVRPKSISEFEKKYPMVAFDANATATVTVKGARLDKKMFAVSWNRAGEVCDGMPKDVEITLKGIKAGDVTPAKMIVRNGRKVYVPLSDKELCTAFKTNGNDKIIISGSYTLDDGRVMDNTLPGRYSIALYGKNGYADSVWVYTYIRTGAVLTFDRLSANAVSYNASGAMTEILITMPDGKSVERIAGTGDDRFKVEYRSNKATGNATAIVRVRDSATGYRKGSVARVSFPIKAKEVTKVYPYDAYTNDMAGEVFIKTAGTLKKGYKGRSFTLYQASADGKKLVELNSRNYKGSLSANTAGQYDLKIENGQTGYFNFKDVTVKGVYTEYKAQARKWTAQEALVLSTDAVIIKDAGDGRVYDSRYITGSENTVEPVTRTGKGVFSVPYAGGSYILPWMPELTVDGKKLSFTAGDYVIGYKNNNRIGTASITVTITQTGAAKHGIGGSRTYTFKIVRQKSMNLNL